MPCPPLSGSLGYQLDRQMFDSVDEVRAQPLHFAVELDRRDSLDQFLDQNVYFHLRQVGAEAEMRSAAAESDVLVGRTFDVELEGLRENLFVAVSRDVPETDLVPGLNLLPTQVVVVSDIAAEIHH